MKKLLSSYPRLVNEWHPTKNGEQAPDNYSYGSGKKVWWLCPKGHSYESTIEKRSSKSRRGGCPYCIGRKVCKDNNLLAIFPEIAREWHPTKNGKLTPNQITPSSTKKVWWLCPKGHSYFSIPKSRTGKNKHGCTYCTKHTSEPEIRILSELKWLINEVNSRFKIDGTEIDIFLPNLNLGIEYDGCYFHKDREVKDLAKNQFLLSRSIHLIRVREKPLKPLSEIDLVVDINRPLEKIDLNSLFKRIIPYADNKIKDKINAYLNKTSFVNEWLFKEYRSYFPSPFPENSLRETNPEISNEWDYDKNYPLRPENFSHGTHHKAWWLCSKGHSYESVIYGRAGKQQQGCPYCSGNKVGNDNNLVIKFPEIANEWHPTKNVGLLPDKVTYGSTKKVWWLCPKGHSYYQHIYSRTGKRKQGCPYCAGKKTLNYDLWK